MAGTTFTPGTCQIGSSVCLVCLCLCMPWDRIWVPTTCLPATCFLISALQAACALHTHTCTAAHTPCLPHCLTHAGAFHHHHACFTFTTMPAACAYTHFAILPYILSCHHALHTSLPLSHAAPHHLLPCACSVCIAGWLSNPLPHAKHLLTSDGGRMEGGQGLPAYPCLPPSFLPCP